MVTSSPGADRDAHTRSSTAAGAILRLLQRYALADEHYRQAIAASLDITLSEATALAHLATGDLAAAALGDMLDLSAGGRTALVERLHQGGHIERRRHQVLTLSARTRRRLAGTTASRAAAIERALSESASHDRCALASLLAAMTTATAQSASSLQRNTRSRRRSP